MTDRFELIDMPKTADAPELMRDAASLLLTEINTFGPNEKRLNSQLKLMDESTGVLAVEGDTVVAGGVYRLDTPDGVLTADLLDLAVTADYQRQGLGLGREVLGLLEDRARKAGAARMTVYSLWSAQGFYKKLDYRLVGQFEFAKTL